MGEGYHKKKEEDDDKEGEHKKRDEDDDKEDKHKKKDGDDDDGDDHDDHDRKKKDDDDHDDGDHKKKNNDDDVGDDHKKRDDDDQDDGVGAAMDTTTEPFPLVAAQDEKVPNVAPAQVGNLAVFASPTNMSESAKDQTKLGVADESVNGEAKEKRKQD